MTRKTYHQKVQEGILLYGRAEEKLKKVCGDRIPIHIHHLTTRKQILYYPDAHFVTKLGKLHIFEVLDSELKDQNLIIADIIQAYLSPNVLRIVFIVPTEKAQDVVSNLALTLCDKLVDMGIPKRELKEVRTLYMLRKEASSAEKVKEFLEENLPV